MAPGPRENDIKIKELPGKLATPGIAVEKRR